ncbi:Transcription regulatory protein SNF12 [Spathaspora sp. JA1]|nr:Transcription regulatory protein SNF12 [Spathaspora sp. JA1]
MHQVSPQQVPPKQRTGPVPPTATGTTIPGTTGAAVPTISYSPTDIIIPPHLYSKVANLEQYKQLIEAERQLDLVLARKALDFQQIQQKTGAATSASSSSGTTGILRVFVYNICENQPWQKQMMSEMPDPLNSEATWTLRVEARFLSDDKQETSYKFSDLLQGISIDLVANEEHPMSAQSSHVVEWRQGDNGLTFDGIDIKRQGVFNLDCKVAILVKPNQFTKLQLSEPMSQFIGKTESTQQEVMYLIWQYVLYKNLFNKNNENYTNVSAIDSSSLRQPTAAIAAAAASAPGTAGQPDDTDDYDLTGVICDDILTDLLHVKSFKFIDLYRLTQPHFKPRTPIIVDYTINTNKSTTLGDCIIDIPIELPNTNTSNSQQQLDSNKATFESLTRADATIQQLNHRIGLGIIALNNANMRQEFYRELAQDPIKFVDQWLESQSVTLKALKSDEGYDEEIVRRAEYFQENQELIKEKIELLLGTGRF